MDYFQQLFCDVYFLTPSWGAVFSGILACLLLIVSGFASGSEIAFFSLSPSDLNVLEESTSETDKKILRLRDNSEQTLATILTDRCNFLYSNKPGDDVSCAVVRIRERLHVSVMIGPPTDSNDDEKMVSLFFSKKGKHIVCGGTTASIVARYLNKDVIIVQNEEISDVPPISKIEGVDLVTEGMVTLNRVLEYGKDYSGSNQDYFNWYYKTDGASRLASLLFEEATDIDFYIGCAMNPAHQNNKELSISFKLKLVDELIGVLKDMNKNVRVNYF